ncbi:unnamed protein product [Rotaria sordida]|uniref:Uncharacterized protein n=1 Tax=Rotaria sordida TaxID=392033 RepID=A0A819B253_9BILA|nr:unnamed protein product [Rotaria sordida]CAF3775540.1 unnamed protein product [Rotaria sordida]CAF3793534.1 unnamed protein product [Rotaria sordida]
MTDEQHRKSKDHIISNLNSKKKKNIRVFVRRKSLPHGILHKSISTKSYTIKHLTATIEKHLNINKKNLRNNKNIIVVNYQPVFVHSHQQKSMESKTIRTYPSTTHNNRRTSIRTISNTNNSLFHSKTNYTLNRQPSSFDLADVEDPLIYIEMMYQQLFTENGQLRSGVEPTVVANRVKEIVTNSRRNSMTRRDSLTSNFYQEKCLLTPFTHSISSKRKSISAPCFVTNTFSVEEEEEFNPLLQTSRIPTTSKRSSPRSSVDNTDSRLQRFHAFFNSCYQHDQKRTSKNEITTNSNYPFSTDDTDNEDFDRFSDFNSCQKTFPTSQPESIDENITRTDSKLLFSSGYQSLQSSQPIKYKIHSENDHYNYSKCIHIPEIVITPPTGSLITIQPVRDVFTKLLNFVFISKDIFLVPLRIFLLRQESMPITY